jgi:hypothetical protein
MNMDKDNIKIAIEENNKTTENLEDAFTHFITTMRKPKDEGKDNLKKQLSNTSNNSTVERYFNTLLTELNNSNILNNNEVKNIKNKVKLNLLTIDEAIISLETLKNTNVVTEIADNDFKYNELSSGYFKPIGDKIANEWNTDGTILNTDKWLVPMPRPPVCINNSPCTVCPTFDISNKMNLKDWNNSKSFTNINLNKKWTNNQTNSAI